MQENFAIILVKILGSIKIGTFWIRSSEPPVTKVSFPLSSTVTAKSFSKVKPTANGWPGLLENKRNKDLEQVKKLKISKKNWKSLFPSPFDILISNVNIWNWKFQVSYYCADKRAQPWCILQKERNIYKTSYDYDK